jgi:hypothetical protein
MRQGLPALLALGALGLLGVFGLAACGKDDRATRLPPIGAPSLWIRWHMVPADKGLAAVYGPSESEGAYRAECRDGVFVIYHFLDPVPPSPKSANVTVVMRWPGVREIAFAPASLVADEDGQVTTAKLTPAFFQPADRQPDLEIGVRIRPSDAVDWLEVNDVLRDVIMACTQPGG